MSCSAFVAANCDSIVESWKAEEAEALAPHHLAESELVGNLKALLTALADPVPVLLRRELNERIAERRALNFALAEIVGEFVTLAAVLREQLEADGARLCDEHERHELLHRVTACIAEACEIFNAQELGRIGTPDAEARLSQERVALGRYVSAIAHDLRGPLAAAKAASQQLDSVGREHPRAQNLSLRVAHSLDRLERMVRELLDLEQLRAGVSSPAQRSVADVNALILDLADELRLVHGDRFDVQVPEQAVLALCAAPDVRRAVWNLAVNAVKYGAPEARILIAVAATPDLLELSVHNEGHELTADEQLRLFAPWARLHHDGSGWGLGLAMVRACAEAHAGDVQVHSAPGAGTTFVITLREVAVRFVSTDEGARARPLIQSAPNLPAAPAGTANPAA